MAKSEKERPDLYIGLVCAAGTDLTDLKSQLAAQLNVVGYETEEIKVSSLIAELLEIPKTEDEYLRIKALMAAGDSIRIHSEDGNGVGAAIIAEIRRRRGESESPSSKAYVIDSLKNPAELALLDRIYPKSLTRKLYGKEIEMGNAPLTQEERANLTHVRFRPFHGVAPSLYQRVFAMRDRKDNRGAIAKWAPKKAIPVGSVFGVERPKVETAASNSVAEILDKIKLPKENQKGEIRDGTADASRADQQ